MKPVSAAGEDHSKTRAEFKGLKGGGENNSDPAGALNVLAAGRLLPADDWTLSAG
ncbi:MAG: hypothetical protein LBP22_01880 [Deltaproteobacteria bacterium]|jgi:hypothetical protein|nr:hypothetical protein [Deltaproteobacteria bacterium]